MPRRHVERIFDFGFSTVTRRAPGPAGFSTETRDIPYRARDAVLVNSTGQGLLCWSTALVKC